jgi:hypothetical protein
MISPGRQLEAELLREVPLWEEDNDLDFLVDDIRIVEIIMLEQEAKDAEKEAKKVSDDIIDYV